MDLEILFKRCVASFFLSYLLSISCIYMHSIRPINVTGLRSSAITIIVTIPLCIFTQQKDSFNWINFLCRWWVHLLLWWMLSDFHAVEIWFYFLAYLSSLHLICSRFSQHLIPPVPPALWLSHWHYHHQQRNDGNWPFWAGTAANMKAAWSAGL